MKPVIKFFSSDNKLWLWNPKAAVWTTDPEYANAKLADVAAGRAEMVSVPVPASPPTL